MFDKAGDFCPDGSRLSMVFRRAIWVPVAVLVLIAVPMARAEVFENKFLRFRLPDGWHCKLEQEVFTCEPPVPRNQKLPMLIMFAAKLQGEHDTFPEYMDHLRQPSTVEGPTIHQIGTVPWVDAKMYESEVKGFYTKYLATVWNGLAILVTFSANKDSYKEFDSLIVPCIRSLEIKSDWKKR